MSLKITIEVDGTTEQQIAPLVAPALGRALTPLPPAPVQPESLHGQAFYQDNTALLQQHIQQLRTQNQFLKTQLAGQSPAKILPSPKAAPSPQTVSAPAVTLTSRPSPHRAQPPPLPHQYQSKKRDAWNQPLKRTATGTAQRARQLLLWFCFGQKWLAVLWLLCGVSVVSWWLTPTVVEWFWGQPEFIESGEEGPGGTTKPVAPPTAPPQPTSDASSLERPPADLPPIQSSPDSKSGSHPPPPPAFQEQPSDAY